MAKSRFIQTNFTAGELSPKLEGRIDLAKYKNGCRKLQNYIVRPHGPVTRRSGTRYIASAKVAADKCRLIPFIFSEEQAYILEFGNQYIRFYMNQGQLQNVDTSQKLLMHFNENDQAILMDDSSNDDNNIDNVTNFANATVGAFTSTARVSADRQKFGAGSLLLNGASDFLQFADNADWDFSTATGTSEAYRIDCWIIPSTHTDTHTIFSQRTGANDFSRLYLGSNVVLHIFKSDNDGSTTFLDSSISNRAITAHGNVQHDTAVFNNGSSSILFNSATQDYLTIPYHSDFDFSSTPFTIRFRMYVSSLPATKQTIFTQGNTGDNKFHSISIDGAGNVIYNLSNGTDFEFTSSATITAGTWNHIEVSGDIGGTGKYRISVNGTLNETTTVVNMGNFSDAVAIGARKYYNVNDQHFDGWIEDFQILKNRVVNTANFTPPSGFHKMWHPVFEIKTTASGSETIFRSTGDETISPGIDWHHIEITGDGGGASAKHYLFVDGILQNAGGTNMVNALANWTQALYIGAHHNHTTVEDFFKGNIDELQIKNAAGHTSDFVPNLVEYGVTGTSPLTMGSGLNIDYAVPYIKADLPALKFVQSYDTLYLFHPDYIPRKLTRTSNVLWQMNEMYFNPGPTMVQAYQPDATLSWADGYTTMQSVAVIEANWTNVGGHLAATVPSSTDWVTGDKVRFTTTNTLPTGLSLATDFWVIKVSATSLKFATTFANALSTTPIAWTDDGTGTHTITEFAKTLTTNANVFLTGDVGRFIKSGSGNALITGLGSATTVNVTIIDAFPTPDSGSATTNNWSIVGSPVATMTLRTATGGGGSLTIPKENDTAYAVTAVNTFRTDDVGRYIRIHDGFLEITAYTSATEVVTKCLRDCSAGSQAADATGNWLLEELVFSGTDGSASTTGNGYPSCGAFYEDRLVVAGVPAFPQTIFGSVTGDYENHAPGVNDDDAVQFTFASKEANNIKWIDEGRVLVAGTIGGEWRIGTADSAITPSNILIKKQTAYGSGDVAPVTIGQNILFLQKAGRKIHELVYSFEQDGYVAPDMALLAEHITKGGILYMAYQQEPYSMIYCVRDDGVMPVMTYLRDQEVVGWQRFVTDGVVESVAVIPGSVPADNQDEVWLSVKRTINGSDARYIEMLEQIFDPGSGDTKSDAFFVDAGATYNGVATASITGLSHLEGETVDVLADGVVSSHVVSSGAITLAAAASKVHVGMPFTSIMQMMRPDAQSPYGTGQGWVKKISKVIARMADTVGLQAGPGESNLKTIRATTTSLITDPTDIELDFHAGWEKNGYITIVQDEPLPSTIIAVMAEIDQE